MKNCVKIAVGLGFVGTLWAGAAQAADPASQTQTGQSVQVAGPARPTAESAKRELKEARASYRAAVKAHGKNSPEAQAARERLNAAQAACKTAQQEKKNAPVQGGGGKSSGEMKSGMGGY